jgi:hypothetical protein|tara:strand:- start:205958 stop:206293 length:336 start_codon:yes stop_codon:yes gene_type:complete
MKKIKVLFLALLVTATFTSIAAVTNINEPSKVAVKEIFRLLSNPSFLIEKDTFATVKFVVNENHELVVLSVKTEREEIESYIKKRLNYKTVTCELKEGMVYIQPVNLVSLK